eukprot:4969290-Pyramimonas_sp.AAC.1
MVRHAQTQWKIIHRERGGRGREGEGSRENADGKEEGGICKYLRCVIAPWVCTARRLGDNPR